MSDSGCLSSSVDWVDMVYCKGWWDGCGGEGIYGCVDEDDISGWSSDEGYNGLCYGSVDEVVFGVMRTNWCFVLSPSNLHYSFSVYSLSSDDGCFVPWIESRKSHGDLYVKGSFSDDI